MNERGQKFLEGEYEVAVKTYELQFTHFMGVFYFWIAVMTFPATAGLIASPEIMTPFQFGLLLIFLAALGIFLSAKMFDIRCSQLHYTHNLNQLRDHLYAYAKDGLPPDFEVQFGKDVNLRCVALTDFGMYMALIMSIVSGVYAGLSIYLFLELIWASILVGMVIAVLGVAIYWRFVNKKVPAPG